MPWLEIPANRPAQILEEAPTGRMVMPVIVTVVRVMVMVMPIIVFAHWCSPRT